MRKLLKGYNTDETEFLVNGFTHGFKIPFQGQETDFIAQNSWSAKQNPQAVNKNIAKELLAGRIAGPFDTPPLDHFHSSPLAVRPKKDPGKFRTLHNLSYPYNQFSVNSGISHQDSTVKYATINQAIHRINTFPTPPYLAKTDIQSAFRLIPVHPDSYHLLGFSWEDKFYYDKCLPFGLSCSCQIFERFSSALQWILEHKLGVKDVFHVIDDFLFMALSKQTCLRHLNTFLALAKHLGIPIAEEKTELPTTILTFLGITLNTTSRQALLPEDKLAKCRDMINNAINSTHITLRQLQSLIGTLNFACSVVQPGRPFLRRLINLTIGATRPHQPIAISHQSKQDLQLWQQFLSQFNGKAFFLYSKPVSSYELNLYTDAAQSIGFGATFSSHWMQAKWPTSWSNLHISILEFYPILVAVSTWAHLMANHSIIFHSDNAAVVHVINSKSAKHPMLLHILRKLTLLCLKHNIYFTSLHIPGKQNNLADALSRFQENPLSWATRRMDSQPTNIQAELLPRNFIW